MKKSVVSLINIITVALIDFLFCELLWGIFYPIEKGYGSRGGWEQLLLIFVENKNIMYGLLIFLGSFSLLYIYHYYEQTKTERYVRFISGDIKQKIIVRPIIIWTATGIIVAILSAVTINILNMNMIKWDNQLPKFIPFLCFSFYIFQRCFLWLFLLRKE